VLATRFLALLALASALAGGCSSAPRVVKVLPHFTDAQGRIALNPSLYERDAYQAQLRKNPAERGGLRFDIQWRAPDTRKLKLLVEMRGALSNRVTNAQLELPLAKGGGYSHWSKVNVPAAEYPKFGELVAWRVTLWSDTNMLADQKSFLW
jgi:hypothetical protein